MSSDLVYVLGLDELEQGSSRVFAELRIDRPQHGVVVHDDLVRGQGDERAAGHGVVGHEDRHLGLVGLDGPGDLQAGQHQAARRVQHQVDGHVVVGQVDGADDFFGVVDIDVAENGEAEEAHRLLPVDEQDDPAAAPPLDAVHQPDPRRLPACFCRSQGCSMESIKKTQKMSPIPPFMGRGLRHQGQYSSA